MTSDVTRLQRSLDARRFEALEEFAEIAASLWKSIAEAAYRGDKCLVLHHCAQARHVTREAFSLARRIGSAEPEVAP